jgi:broad specificity phosphatase PhoE
MGAVIFVRHGQSEAQTGVPEETRGSSPLTDLGHVQARHLATTLSGRAKPLRLFSSRFLRAQDTASATSTAMIRARKEQRDICVERLAVEEFACLQHKRTSADEHHERVTAYWERNDPGYVDGPDAESFLDLLVRVSVALGKLRGEPNDVVVFSHAQFMKAVLWSVLHVERRATMENIRLFRQFTHAVRVPNTAAMLLTTDSPGGPWLVGPISDEHVPIDKRTE